MKNKKLSFMVGKKNKKLIEKVNELSELLNDDDQRIAMLEAFVEGVALLLDRVDFDTPRPILSPTESDERESLLMKRLNTFRDTLSNAEQHVAMLETFAEGVTVLVAAHKKSFACKCKSNDDTPPLTAPKLQKGKIKRIPPTVKKVSIQSSPTVKKPKAKRKSKKTL